MSQKEPAMQAIDHSRPIAVTMGCPSGIGPEVALAATIKAQQSGINCHIIGDRGSLIDAAKTLGLDANAWFDPSQSSPAPSDGIRVIETIPPLPKTSRVPGAPTKEGGLAQLSWIDHAVDLAQHGHVASIVTGPVSKKVIADCGAPGAETFRGHTEHIAHRLGSHNPVMVFVADGFAVSLVTTHVPLRDITSCLTIERVRHAAIETILLLARLPIARPRVVVAALNPHAGEGGLLGEEEMNVIVPAIEATRAWARTHHVDCVVHGPTPAEAAFRIATDGAYDGVVAMYHDQGTIPMKLRYFGRAVNVTAGLPIIRTSVDHGTAYDIAGQGIADGRSMLEAIYLAERLANTLARGTSE